MQKLLLAICLSLPLYAHAASPDLIIKTGQVVTISGRVNQEQTTKLVNGRVAEVKLTTLKPINFVATKPDQAFNSRLVLIPTSPEIESSLTNLYGQDAMIDCLISFENKSTPICNIQAISRFTRPQEPKPQILKDALAPGGGWFLGVHEFILNNQLNKCENYKLAGNSRLFKTCKTRILNSYDYLLKRANESKLPLAGWGFCSNQIEYDLPSGTQCLAAVELLCPPNENKEFADFNQCYKVMTSGAWMSNPNIQRMTFTTPAR